MRMYTREIYCYLEREVLLHVLDDHDQKGKSNGEDLLGIRGAEDESRRHVGTSQLQGQ